MQTLKNLLNLLNSKLRLRAIFLLGIILIMALLDMIGVASIMPFIAVLGNPELVETNNILKSAYNFSEIFGVETINQFLFALGIFVFLMLLISLSFKALTVYLQAYFSQDCEYSIGKLLVEGYLHQPYSWFLGRNSADLSKNILSEVEEVVGAGFNPMMVLITQSAVTIALLILLILVDTKLTIIVALTLGASYVILFKIIRNFIEKIGYERLRNNQQRYKSVSEAFGAFKEVKVGGLEQVYIERFSVSANTYAKNKAIIQVISQLPRFILEMIAFGGMVLMVLFLMTKVSNLANALPIIALYAFAGYRLLPALQQIYGSISQLKFIGPAINHLRNDLNSLRPIKIYEDNQTISFEKEISLKNAYYNYPNSSRQALKNINLTIYANSTIGLVGATGSGKTTIVDLILGLLKCQKGVLTIDGKVLNNENLRSWQKIIGYVPQQIYLSDTTIAENIAFGVDNKNVNQEAVEEAAKIANIHDFVVNELPLKYKTIVGERGIRLSGGQRQRIGIARALYFNPKLLVMDEATSALDNLTEKEVMSAVSRIKLNTTIILIAHRISTVKECDNIFVLEKGELKDQGSFDKLKENNDFFRLTSNT